MTSMFAAGDGGAVSTVIENLLLRKQKLVEQLEKAPSVEDRYNNEPPTTEIIDFVKGKVDKVGV